MFIAAHDCKALCLGLGKGLGVGVKALSDPCSGALSKSLNL